MNTNYFSKVRILDGGMGQELLAKGLNAKEASGQQPH